MLRPLHSDLGLNPPKLENSGAKVAEGSSAMGITQEGIIEENTRQHNERSHEAIPGCNCGETMRHHYCRKHVA
jgi:hypothetical protein